MSKGAEPQGQGLDAVRDRLWWAQDEKGRLVPVQCDGGEASSESFGRYWDDMTREVAEARALVAQGKKSPLYYWMRVCQLDEAMLADYLGLWAWRVRRHMRPEPFARMSPRLLSRYAAILQIDPQAIRSVPERDPETLPGLHPPIHSEGKA